MTGKKIFKSKVSQNKGVPVYYSKEALQNMKKIVVCVTQ